MGRESLTRSGRHPAARLSLAAVLSCAVLACGSAGPGHASPAPLHPIAVGVNTDITWGIPATQISTEVNLMRGAALRWIRASVDLSGAEYQGPGRLNLPYIGQVDA